MIACKGALTSKFLAFYRGGRTFRFPLQGSTLTLTRLPLESNISEWKVKKANEPKILARSGNYF